MCLFLAKVPKIIEQQVSQSATVQNKLSGAEFEFTKIKFMSKIMKLYTMISKKFTNFYEAS